MKKEMVDTQQPVPLWETQGDDKRVAVQGLFARIAKNYDLANRLLSFNRDRKWRELATSKLNLKPGDSALDLCCGTGDFLPPLRKRVGDSGKLVGLDFCAPMLDQAAAKDPKATLILADACNLPLGANEFEGVSVGWGIRNVPDIEKAHTEIFRVLKPGGHFVSLDCAEPSSPLVRKATGLGRSLMTRLLGASLGNSKEYAYLDESTKRFKSRAELVSIMEQAGFVDVQFQDLMFGNICIHWGTKP
ncbi:MAG: ubiquinone/menaquinone biosynthesis methyltransferase [Armatimonadetes bacterium]|nr:ubiquinone/menaquinone biosynthesis methyltransferase [Armatimonadota bacterium]